MRRSRPPNETLIKDNKMRPTFQPPQLLSLFLRAAPARRALLACLLVVAAACLTGQPSQAQILQPGAAQPLPQAAPGLRSGRPDAGPEFDLSQRIAADVAFAFVRMLQKPACLDRDYQIAVLNPVAQSRATSDLSTFQLDRVKSIVQDAVTKAYLPLASISEGQDVASLVSVRGATADEGRRIVEQIEAAFGVMAKIEVLSSARNRADIKIELYDRGLLCLEVVGQYQVRIDEPWLRDYSGSQARLLAQLIRAQGQQLLYIAPVENFSGDILEDVGGSCGQSFRNTLVSTLQTEHRLSVSRSEDVPLHLQIQVDASSDGNTPGIDGEVIYATKFTLIKDGVVELISTPATRVKAFKCDLDAHPRDSDEDGLFDKEEREQGTDPKKADSDGDGLKDGDEVKLFQTDPLLADSDNGGMTDKRELELGLDPLNKSDDQASPQALSQIVAARNPSPVKGASEVLKLRWGDTLRFKLLNESGQPQSALCLANDESNESFLLSEGPMALKGKDGRAGELFYPGQAASFDFAVGQVGQSGTYDFFVQCVTHSAWSPEALAAWQQAFSQQLDANNEPYQFQPSAVTEALLANLRRVEGFGEMLFLVEVR